MRKTLRTAGSVGGDADTWVRIAGIASRVAPGKGAISALARVGGVSGSVLVRVGDCKSIRYENCLVVALKDILLVEPSILPRSSSFRFSGTPTSSKMIMQCRPLNEYALKTSTSSSSG